MRKKTIGIVIALSLSAPLAIAQEYPAPGPDGREDAVVADRSEVTTDAAPDAAEDRAAAQSSATSTPETASESRPAARPETTAAKVITDTLMSGEKMELTIRFKVNSDQIKGIAHKQILEIANALNGSELAGMRIGVQGHTDADGDEDYNLDLSFRRSVTVVRTLVEMYGIEPGRLDVRGYGESRPIASNQTDEGKALNRRVTLVSLDSKEENAQ